MIKKKICMLGSVAVGKTSLVKRFVKSMFSEKYITTVGVKIDQKKVVVDGEEILLLLWDIHGKDEFQFQKLKSNYLRGMSGYFLVADGTRRKTLGIAKKLKGLAEDTVNDVPFILLLNKVDLHDEWEIEDDTLKSFQQSGWTVLKTSAKTGEHVESAFRQLTRKIMRKSE